MLRLAATLGSLALAGCGPGAPAGSGGAIVASGAGMIGGPFQLTDQNGAPTDQRVLDGKWTAVFFGYTECPDACPTTLQTLAEAQTALGDRAKALQVVLISVDPERDTPAQLKAYLSTPAFPRGAIGLTGAPAQIAAVAKAYRVYFQKAGKGDGYSVDHTSIIYLMNPQGKFDRPITETQTPAAIAAQIGQAMQAAAG
jgi:protein SCO1/2